MKSELILIRPISISLIRRKKELILKETALVIYFGFNHIKVDGSLIAMTWIVQYFSTTSSISALFRSYPAILLQNHPIEQCRLQPTSAPVPFIQPGVKDLHKMFLEGFSSSWVVFIFQTHHPGASSCCSFLSFQVFDAKAASQIPDPRDLGYWPCPSTLGIQMQAVVEAISPPIHLIFKSLFSGTLCLDYASGM